MRRRWRSPRGSRNASPPPAPRTRQLPRLRYRAPSSCGPRSWRSPPFRNVVMPMALGRGGAEDGGPDGRVRGDEQDVTAGAAEGEVDGAGQADLADEIAGLVEHLDAAERRGVDASRAIHREAVGEPGDGDGEQPAARQMGAVADVEGEDVAARWSPAALVMSAPPRQRRIR